MCRAREQAAEVVTRRGTMNNDEFSRLVQQYERLVYTICYQFTHDHQTAEDLAQETFLSAYTHRDSCPPDSYKPWLARIASNKARDHLKSAWHRRVSAAEDDALAVLDRSSAQPPPEELAIAREQAERIRGSILALKEPYHQAAVLFFLEEKSITEIAEALRRPPKTVHTQIYRARQLLQAAMYEGGSTRGTVP